MANSLTKDLEIMFENFVEGYDADCVISREADTSYPTPQDMQRSQDIFYRPQNYNATVVQGLDVSASAKTDVIQRMVPTVFRTPDNVVYTFDGKELRDKAHKERMGKAASLSLAAEIDKNLYATVAA
jgi:P22 coat protein - gene protein 5